MLSSTTLMIDERSLDTVFAEDFNFTGKVVCKKSAMIKGKFQGKITVEQGLYLAVSAKVEGEIEAKNLIIQGKYAGDAKVCEGFTLRQSAQAVGNIQAGSLEIEKGAVFNGNFTMPKQNGEEKNA